MLAELTWFRNSHAYSLGTLRVSVIARDQKTTQGVCRPRVTSRAAYVPDGLRGSAAWTIPDTTDNARRRVARRSTARSGELSGKERPLVIIINGLALARWERQTSAWSRPGSVRARL